MSSIPAAQPLASQVGGHAGVLTTEDGSLVIKPALPLELQFYQALLLDSQFESLRPFIPKFLGTLKLEGKVDETQPALTCDSPPTQSLVLENLSHRFLKPNILDVKLGTVLYDESASPEKVARMQQTARETTSLETGVRLTGFQVYDNVTSQAVNTPKSYGKSIRASDLPDGIARFFPVGSSSTEDTSTALASTKGLPLAILLPILRAIHGDITEIRDAVSSVDMRMVGGSLLVIYEADWARAEESAQWLGLEEDDEEEEEEEDDEKDGDSDTHHAGPPYVVKLIDFAHTRLTPGQGPDEGVLLGIDTILKLLDERIRQLSTD